MKTIYWALIVLGVFVAVWFLFVVPAERRHHERKLAMLQKKIDQRQTTDDAAEESGSKEAS